jgi:hypothetical protein
MLMPGCHIFGFIKLKLAATLLHARLIDGISQLLRFKICPESTLAFNPQIDWVSLDSLNKTSLTPKRDNLGI